jgi:hypothetical protein
LSDDTKPKKKGLKQRVKGGFKLFVKVMATAAAVVVNPPAAGQGWLTKIFRDSEVNGIRKKIAQQFVCKYWYINPKSIPTMVIAGHAEKIEWREGTIGDVYIKDLDHPRYIPQALDNIGHNTFFSTETELRNYLNKQLEDGILRRGSYLLTVDGAKQLGLAIVESLEEYINEREEDPILIPRDFLDFVASVRDDFVRKSGVRAKFYGYDPSGFINPSYLDRLSAQYPFEFNLVNIMLNYVYNMYRTALFSEVNQQDNIS